MAVVASDDRFTVSVNMDGRLFDEVPHLDRPFLWVQSDGSEHGGNEHDATRRTRDALLARLLVLGALVTVEGSLHMSFTDLPAYLTPAGRRVIGLLPGSQVGPLSVESTTPLVADILTGFMGPVLGCASHGDLYQVTRATPPFVSSTSPRSATDPIRHQTEGHPMTPTVSSEARDVIVVGAGQAGLAVGGLRLSS